MPLLVVALALAVTNQGPPPGQTDAAVKAAAVIAALAAANFAEVEAQFNGRMRSTWPAGLLATRWTMVVTQVGAAVTTTCQFERAALDVGLASRGVAVLRYAKRSQVHGTKMAASSSMTVKEEVIDDVGEAIKAVRARPRIDPARIFVLGHSLGGMLIPRIVHAHPSIAGAVVLAGAARPIEDAIVEQTRYLAMQDGAVSPEEQSQIDAAVKSAAAVKALGLADMATRTPVFGATAAYWLDLRGYDPPIAARNVKIPLLVLQGERDYQVTMEEYGRWKNALAGTATATLRSYPALNHLFIAGTGKSLPAEYLVPSHVAEAVIRDIAAFITR